VHQNQFLGSVLRGESAAMSQVNAFCQWIIFAAAIHANLLSAAEVSNESNAEAYHEGDLFFESDVRPILKAHCLYCHGEDGEVKGGVDLRQVRLMTDAQAVDVSAPENSRLLEVVETGEMLMEGSKELGRGNRDRISSHGSRCNRRRPRR